MGFWDILDNVLNGTASVLNHAANSIDKKSDEELERMCANNDKTPAEMRELAAQAHMLYEQRHSADGDDYDS